MHFKNLPSKRSKSIYFTFITKQLHWVRYACFYRNRMKEAVITLNHLFLAGLVSYSINLLYFDWLITPKSLS